MHEFTRSDAKALLESHPNYRPCAVKHVDSLVAAMIAGHWDDHRGDPIRVHEHEDGMWRLIDGQHRLSAFLRTPKPVFRAYLQFVPLSWWGDDGQKKRSFGDALGAAGVANSNKCAAIARIMCLVAARNMSLRLPSKARLDQVFSMMRPDIEWSVSAVGRRFDGSPQVEAGGAPTMAAFALGHRFMRGPTESLLYRAKTGLLKDLHSDPAAALRRFLHQRDGITGTLAFEKFCCVVKAIVDERSGKRVNLYRVVVDSGNSKKGLAEAFREACEVFPSLEVPS